MSKFQSSAVQNKASLWICFMVLIVAATMMHPSFASLISIVTIAGLLGALRRIAHSEGANRANNLHRNTVGS